MTSAQLDALKNQICAIETRRGYKHVGKIYLTFNGFLYILYDEEDVRLLPISEIVRVTPVSEYTPEEMYKKLLVQEESNEL